MLLINNQIVGKILDIRGCMEALETGYRDLISERAVYRGRYDLFVPNDDPKLMYRWGTMEGASTYRLGYVANCLTLGVGASHTCRIAGATPERLEALTAQNLEEL